jgi:hypothetical protein
MAEQKGEKTRYRGFTKLDNDSPGGYIERGDFTVLPEVSGEGGYGGPGEYMKYPETEVVEYSMEKSALQETNRITLGKVDFVGPSAEEAAKAANPVSQAKSKRKASRVSEPVMSDKPVARKNVKYKGAFGEITVPYEHAFIDGVAMILVNSSFDYDPPKGEDGFSVELDGTDYKVYNLDIKFVPPGYNKRVTILLVETENG